MVNRRLSLFTGNKVPGDFDHVLPPHPADAPLRHVGHQDITAQVDFTSVIGAGRRNGLESLGIVNQGDSCAIWD